MASIVVTGDTSGAINIAAPAVAGTNTLTLPASTGTLVVTGGAQTIEFADGSAAAPSITNSGDTNTGMFFPAADTIAFTEGGTEAMRLDSSGNVGIGTSSPADKLDVARNSSSNSTSGLTLTNTSTSGYGSAVNWNLALNSVAGVNGRMYCEAASSTASFMAWQTTIGGTLAERMRIASTGLVSTTGSILSGGYVAGAGYYRSSGMVNETVTVTTEATVYSMNKDSGGGGSSSTSTYNITGLSNTDGSSAIIYVRNSNTAGGVNTVTIVQIHGTKVWEGNVQNTTKTASFGVFRQNGAWQTTAWSVGGVLNNVW
jgi:hypothetical protein